MSDRGRPLAVDRYRNSWAWLPVLVALPFAFFFAEEVGSARDNRRLDPRSELRTTGRVVADSRGVLKIRYRNPITDQRVDAPMYTWTASPDEGDTVTIDVERDDPRSVNIAGDAFPLTTNVGLYVSYVALAAIPFLLRRLAVRRAQRLMSSSRTAFAMKGAIGPGRRWRRPLLHLYPLDASPGATPLCSVPLMSTGQAPVGVTLQVEVKGSPRPLGRVIARTQATVLWPASRALRRAPMPLPAESGVVAGLRQWAGPPSPWLGTSAATRVLRLRLLTVAFLAGVVVAIAVASVAGARASIDTEDRYAIAQVVDHEGEDDVVVLRYGHDLRWEARAPADFASDYPVGVRYPVRIDRDDRTRARLVTEPYNVVNPIMWGVVPLAGAVLFLGAGWLRWQRNQRVARSGPWWYGSAQVVGPTLVVSDEAGQVVCTIEASDAFPPPSPAANPADIVVAGDGAPGSPTAVWLDGVPVAVAGPAGLDAEYADAEGDDDWDDEER